MLYLLRRFAKKQPVARLLISAFAVQGAENFRNRPRTEAFLTAKFRKSELIPASGSFSAALEFAFNWNGTQPCRNKDFIALMDAA